MAPPESGIKLIKHCQACNYISYSSCTCSDKLIEPSQWDGSDFFIVWPLPKHIFVTERVAQVIHKNKLTGIVLKSPGDMVFSGSDTISPGRLAYWMPESRARELGENLGIY